MNSGVKKQVNGWYYYIELERIDGKRIVLNRKGGTTRAEALKTLKEILEQCDNNVKALKDDLTVSDYIDIWFKDNIALTESVDIQNYYKRIINSFIKPRFGAYQLKTLNSNILQEFLNKKYIGGISKTTIIELYNILFNSLELAINRYNHLKNNPMANVKIPGNTNNTLTGDRVKILSISEFNKIIKHFPKGTDFYVPIQIAYNTGMRTSEVFALTWDCIDLENKLIRVEKILVIKNKVWILQPPMSKDFYRIIPIDDNLVHILKEHKKNQSGFKNKIDPRYENFVCTRNTGDIITPRSTKTISKVINYELFIDMSFQSFRHSYAAKLIYSNMDITNIQHRLGYKTLKLFIETYYSKLNVSSRKKLDKKLESIKELTDSLKNNNPTDSSQGGTSCKVE